LKTLYIITKIANGLEMLKGFGTGYSTGNKNNMLVEIEGKVYLMNIKELGEGIVDDYLDLL